MHTRNRKSRNQKEAGKGLSMGSSDDDSDDSAVNRRRNNSVSRLYDDGEKVLAYHGLRIYEAKVQKSEIRKNEVKYFVHYLGWSKTWDEWVNADRLLKPTEENFLKQQALDQKQGVEKNPKSGRVNQTKSKLSYDSKVDKEDVKSNGAKGKKRKNDSSTEKDTASIENSVNIEIPSTLKQQLLDDWEYVIRQNKFVKLPRSPSVDNIFEKYLEYRSKKDGMKSDSVAEILKGLRGYFDKALPVILLYNKEREQYHHHVEDGVSPSSVYGAEHLLRLFVKLPELLPYVNIEEELAVQLGKKFTEFLDYMERKHNSLFVTSYDG